MAILYMFIEYEKWMKVKFSGNLEDQQLFIAGTPPFAFSLPICYNKHWKQENKIYVTQNIQTQYLINKVI